MDRFEGKRFDAPERHRHAQGRPEIYFTDPLFTPLDQRDLDFYGVYHMTPKGGIEAIARWQIKRTASRCRLTGRRCMWRTQTSAMLSAYDVDRDGKTANSRSWCAAICLVVLTACALT